MLYCDCIVTELPPPPPTHALSKIMGPWRPWFKIFYFVFNIRKKLMQVWNNMRVSKWWQNFTITISRERGVNYYLKFLNLINFKWSWGRTNLLKNIPCCLSVSFKLNILPNYFENGWYAVFFYKKLFIFYLYTLFNFWNENTWSIQWSLCSAAYVNCMIKLFTIRLFFLAKPWFSVCVFSSQMYCEQQPKGFFFQLFQAFQVLCDKSVPFFLLLCTFETFSYEMQKNVT